MTEGSESSTGLNSVVLGQDAVTLSPEDIAWADSCLSTDRDMLDSGWNSLKAALLETLDSQNHSSPHERESSSEEVKMEIISSENTGNTRNVEEKTSTQYHSTPYFRDRSPLVLQPPLKEIHSIIDIDDIRDSDNTPISIASTSEGPESSSDDRLKHENAEDFWSKHKIEDVFLPTYNENLRDLVVADPEADFVFQEFQSSEDIFKIWDFDIPPEENDLTKQLNKALAENPLEPTLVDSEAWTGVQDKSLDDVISRIADLALSPKSD